MTEAVFGLVGVLIGSLIPWFQTYWVEIRSARKNARYLAIRIVCILDEYLENCVEVVKDNGLSCGQRNKDGNLEVQFKAPSAPIYPDDVDWKSIDHELMYKILSLPSEVDTAKRLINESTEISVAPDFEDFFIERKYWHCRLGLVASNIVNELCSKYRIREKTYQNWNPSEYLKESLASIHVVRNHRFQENAQYAATIIRKNIL